MRKLSTREKILIYIAVMLVILCGGYFFLLEPAQTSLYEAQDLYDTALAEKQLVDMELANESGVQQEYDALIKYHEEHSTDYGPAVSNEELEQIVLACLEKEELVPISTAITPATSTVLKSGVESQADTVVTMGSIKVKAKGTWEHIHTMLDDMEQKYTMAAVSYSLQDEDEVIRIPDGEETENSKLPFEQRTYIADMVIEYYMEPVLEPVGGSDDEIQEDGMVQTDSK